MRLADDNPMLRTMKMTLAFEVIVCILAVPGMIQVDDVPVGLALGAGGAAALLAGVASGLLGRRPIGWPLAWLAQVACIGLGLLTPWMYAVGGGFAALFVLEFYLGGKLPQRQ